MVALNLFSLHHSKRKLHGIRGSGEPNDETCRNRSSESSIDVSSESLEPAANGNLLEAYELMFSFTGISYYPVISHQMLTAYSAGTISAFIMQLERNYLHK